MTAPAFLTNHQAEEAFQILVLPSITSAMKAGHIKREHLHVVVLEPGVPYQMDADLPILFEYSIGRRKHWEKWEGGLSFDDFARGKARLSWRTGLPSREVVLTKPHLLLPSDCRLWGSSVYGGFITGVSGVEPYFDEMFANMTSAAMVGEASHYANLLAQDPDAPDFL